MHLADIPSRNVSKCACVRACVCRSGVELVFLGTKSGLTRYLTLADNLSDPSVFACFAVLHTRSTTDWRSSRH